MSEAGTAGRGPVVSDRLRLNLLRLMALALSILAVVGVVDQLGQDDSGAAVAAAGDTPAAVTTTDDAGSGGQSVAAPTPTVEELLTPLVIDRLSSPAANTARAEGRLRDRGALTVNVVADGVAVGAVELIPDDLGVFVIEIPGLAPGPQTVCLSEACARVLIADPAAEPSDEVQARIAAAIERAATIFDFRRFVPEWSIEATGPNSSTGGYAVEDAKTIFISANSGRSDDDYLVTVLHELGHAVDFTYMTPEMRDAYRVLRGLDPAIPWGATDELVLGEDRWRNSGEDFAEVFVAWALDGAYETQTAVIAAQPSAADLVAFCQLVTIEGVTCS